MAPSTVYTRASSRLSSSSSHPSVLQTFTSANIRRCRNNSTRNLWWWSRHGTYSSTNDENLEERLQRHQKIMRHRYSRALRRRAMWDRDDSSTPWLWHLPDGRLTRKVGACRTVSSSEPNTAKIDEKDTDKPLYGNPSMRSWNDFEAFKAEVDRALARDPYETLFGKRLQSPPTENNSSWISWLFNRGDSLHNPDSTFSTLSNRRKIDIEVLDKNGMPMKPQPAKDQVEKGPVNQPDKSLSKSTEYVYDPITGRKVPRPPVKQEITPQPQLTFLETLFAEHGSTPDKPVKQTVVHGHDPQFQKRLTKSAGTGSKNSLEKLGGFGDSRSHEYRQLRATILGTSIDTTAVFGGQYNVESEVDHQDTEKKTRVMPVLDENAPLFSGTTYESKADKLTQTAEEKSKSWLQKEGFQTEGNSSTKSSIPPKLEPSFDRMRSAPGKQERKFIVKLQPAIDRVQQNGTKSNISIITPTSATAQPVTKSGAQSSDVSTSLALDQREDVDLLRASDVRAATRVVRTTKQETAQAKEQRRGELERDFDTLQSKEPGTQVPNRSELIPRPVSAIARFTEASTKSHIGITEEANKPEAENFKEFLKPYRPGRIDLTAPLQFKDESLSDVASIYKQKPIKPRNETVSFDIQSEQKARSNITESLRLMSKQAEEIRKKNDMEIVQLAEEIKEAYEAESGPIDLSLAQNSTAKSIQRGHTSIEQSRTEESSNGTTDFFAERAGFLAKVNDLKTHVTSLRVMTTELENAMANKTLAPSQELTRVAELQSEATNRLKEAENVGKELDKALAGQSKASHPLSTATVKPGITRYPAIERHTQVFEPQYIQLLNGVKNAKMNLQAIDSSLHDLKRSRVRANEQQPAPASTTSSKPQTTPSVSELKELPKENPLSSPYLLLVYNKTTGEVDQTALDRLPWSPNERSEKVNPISIMGNLNYPAAFVTHFVNLEKSGYELSSGGGDMLVFQKNNITAPLKSEKTIVDSVVSPSTVLRNNIAVEEASSQPEITETIAQPKSVTPKEAATVLDEIPTDIPPPGPAAPIAPPAIPAKKPSKSGPKVRRQEQVFSGTIPVRSAYNSQQRAGQDSASSNGNKNRSRAKSNQEPGVFARTTRTIKRGVLGVAAFGAAAYTVGVVAEGIGAQAQADDDATLGPRRKLVMPMGQRPGIYSTESSRAD